MSERLKYALDNKIPLTGADASFYIHEATESTKMLKEGINYIKAHEASLNKYQVSPFSVYHPEVINAVNTLGPRTFNDKWIDFWMKYNSEIRMKP